MATLQLLSEKQAAAIMGIDRSTLCKIRLRGEIRHYRITRTGIKYSLDMIQEFLAKKEQRIAI